MALSRLCCHTINTISLNYTRHCTTSSANFCDYIVKSKKKQANNKAEGLKKLTDYSYAKSTLLVINFKKTKQLPLPCDTF